MSYRRQPRNKTDQKQRAANNLNHSDKWRHDLRSRNADFHKASASEGVREEKLLYVFGKENPAGQNADQQDCLRRTIPPDCLCLYWHLSVVVQLKFRTR